MMPLTDPWFYLCAIPAVLIMGISKGGFGTGFGIVATPLMALTVGPTEAAAIMLPILCVMDIVGLKTYFGQWDVKNMKILLPAAVLGIIIGHFTVDILSERWILLLLAGLSFGFLAFRALAYKIAQLDPKPPRLVPGVIWGALSGLTSFVAHAGGPPITIFLMPQRLDKRVYVATNVIFFAVVNYIKLIPYFLEGRFPVQTLATSAVLMPLAPVGVILGMRLVNWLSDRWFYGLCYILLGCTAVKLAWDGIFWVG